jgi:hypothetical protein
MDNINMELREIGWGCVNLIHLAEDRDQCRAVVNTEMKLQVAQNVGKFSSDCTTDDLSRNSQLHGVSSIQRCVTSSADTLPINK